MMNKNLGLTTLGKIHNELIGCDYDIAKVEAILTHICGCKVSWVDSNIDCGLDDDKTENNYLIRDLFSTEDEIADIRVFYGDVDRRIDYATLTFN